MNNIHIPQKRTMLATALAATLFAASSTHAAIVLESRVEGRGLNTVATTAETISYTLSGGNVVAIGFYTDGSSQTIDPGNITLGGVAADFIDNGSETRSRTRVAYWLNPTGSDIQVTFSGAANNYAYSIFELSGVDTTAPVVFNSSQFDGGDPPTTLTTTAAESFIVDFYGTNANGTATIDSGPFGSPQSFGVTADGSQTGTISSAFGIVGPGTHIAGWVPIGGGNNDGTAGFAFAAAVPEPSSSALLGAGFALLIIRRRR